MTSTSITKSTSKNHKHIWDNCLALIKNEIDPQSFQTWFAPITPYEYKHNTLTIQVPNQFFYEWIEEHYLSLLCKVITQELGPKARLEYLITKNVKNKNTSTPNPSAQKKNKLPDIISTPNLATPLNPTYTLDNFVEGACNSLTRAAAQAVMQNPGKTSFNPLVIFGPTGSGKSHIEQAIYYGIQSNLSDKRVIYISSEKFVNQFIESLRHNVLQPFINYYTSADVLLLDDIQILAGKPKTQEILFSIFNHLHQSGKQIVMTSDCRPCDLKGLEKRLLSRFKWGLTTDLQPPSFETRVAIIKSKIHLQNLKLEMPLIEYIATHVKTNIRDIEGVLTSIRAHTSLNKEATIDQKLIQKLLQNQVQHFGQEKITLPYLQKIIANYFNLTVEQMKSKSRVRQIVIARHLAIHFARKLTNHTLKFIGEAFGAKDHTSVRYALKSVDNMLQTDGHFRADYERVERLTL